MKFKTLLLAALVSATAFAQTTVPITTTVNVPLQVTVTQTGTTITIAAQTTSIPIPPGCSTPQPPTTTTSVQCPAGSSGSYTQTTTYACVGSTWTPTTAPTSPPAGACTTTPPSSVNQVYSNGVAYWTFNMSYGATVNYTDTAGRRYQPALWMRRSPCRWRAAGSPEYRSLVRTVEPAASIRRPTPTSCSVSSRRAALC